MTEDRKNKRRPSWFYFPLLMVVGIPLVVCSLLVFYQPDRPIPDIEPGSSAEPSFVVQVIRPRVGLPFGGILPPGIFGVDAQLSFDSSSDGAQILGARTDRIELVADDWELVLVLDDRGRVTSETYVAFYLLFENRVRKVRCHPGDQVVGTMTVATLSEEKEIAGNFDIELPYCEDAETGKSLGWPAQPLVLHGSFDRLPLDKFEN